MNVPAVTDPAAAVEAGSPAPSRAVLPRSLADRTGYLLAQAQLSIRERAEQALVPFGLGADAVEECSPKHVACLLVIADEGPLSQQELSETIAVDRTTIAGAIPPTAAPMRWRPPPRVVSG